VSAFDAICLLIFKEAVSNAAGRTEAILSVRK
jgi:hypothetical protein